MATNCCEKEKKFANSIGTSVADMTQIKNSLNIYPNVGKKNADKLHKLCFVFSWGFPLSICQHHPEVI
jgi:hypothetical protein